MNGSCRIRTLIGIGLTAMCLAPLCAQTTAEPRERSLGQTVYVPVYSHIYRGDREDPFPLTATLSIRNTDLNLPFTVLSIDYSDSSGKLLRKYLDKPARMAPLASIRFIVKESDRTGGSGASFVVRWKSEKPVSQPLIESVMIGTRHQQGVSFTSRGQIIPD